MGYGDYEHYTGTDGKYIMPRAKKARMERSPFFVEVPMTRRCHKCGFVCKGTVEATRELFKDHACLGSGVAA